MESWVDVVRPVFTWKLALESVDTSEQELDNEDTFPRLTLFLCFLAFIFEDLLWLAGLQ